MATGVLRADQQFICSERTQGTLRTASHRESGSGYLTRYKGFQVWVGRLSIFAIAAEVVLVLTLAQTDVLQ